MDTAEVKMGERLAIEFSQDPLYKTIIKLRLEDKLFDDFIENLVESKDYTTTDFEKWYCTDETESNYLGTAASMRHWLKELNGYIESRNIGRNIAMDYQAIFRLKMVLLLRKNGSKIGRIAEMVGVRAISPVVVSSREEEGSDFLAPTSSVENQVQLLKQMLMSSQFRELVTGIVKEQQLLYLPGEDVIQELREEMLEVKGIQAAALDKATALEENLQEFAIKAHQVDQRLVRSGECGAALAELYATIKGYETRDQKLAGITSMEQLLERYPEEQMLIQLYIESVHNLIAQEDAMVEQAARKARSDELENKLVGLYELVASESTAIHDKKVAMESMKNLTESYPDLQTVIRVYMDAAQTKLREIENAHLEGIEADCRRKLGELMESITSGSTTLAEKENVYQEMEKLRESYPTEGFTIQIYLDAAINKLTIYKQDQKDLQVREIKVRCLELFNKAVSETAPAADREQALKELHRLHDENPDLSFEIRSYIANAESRMRKEKKGFFSRLFG